MKKRSIFYISLMILLSGCVIAKPITMPDGAAGYEIKGPGTSQSMGDCMNKAREVCGGNYKVIDKEETSSFVWTGYGMAPTKSRSMFVECE